MNVLTGIAATRVDELDRDPFDCPLDQMSINNNSCILAQEIDSKSINAGEWEAFAQKCGASARAAYRRISNMDLKTLGRYRLRIFDIYASTSGGREKIGQCAFAASTRGRSVFVDRLHLLPGHDQDWTAAMTSVLAASGARSLEYGWQLNIEPPRQADLASIDGVSIETIRSLVVHAVDFKRWKSWEDYYRAMSENSKRNAKAAQRELPGMRLLQRFGRRSLLSVPALVRLRAAMAERKGLDLKVALSALSYMSWIVLCPELVVTNLAMNGRQVLATFFGVEFGEHTYYLEGASRSHNGGAAWFLIMAMLRRAYERHPAGKFIMGYIDTSTTQDEGLLRSRGACRVSDFPTSVVRFRYEPA